MGSSSVFPCKVQHPTHAQLADDGLDELADSTILTSVPMATAGDRGDMLDDQPDLTHGQAWTASCGNDHEHCYLPIGQDSLGKVHAISTASRQLRFRE